ncbi:hypothetical protein DVH24_012715 [Malus domestica]|uniref:Protein kinase domain-containing protein n=1 Tax=Malus domestica TaxID=3750 RepID=A0A498HV22_MALDO|nr:hypothetical protein DVH24_012715 [Malus domestica]
MGFDETAVVAVRVEFVLLVLLLGCMSFGYGDSQNDQGTLLEIKKAFRDVDNVLYEWTDPPSLDYCVWRGVTCDNSLNVIALNLSGLNLGGEISSVIGDLENLQSIDLRGNHLSGQIPDEIGDCSALQNMYFLRILPEYILTFVIFNAELIEYFLNGVLSDLSFNEIFGDIPFSISKLKQLENLILKNNQLIGPLPSTLSQIPNLKILDLAQNNLTGEIPRLIYWNEVLHGLRGNNLVGTLSPDMCQLTGLWYFDVRNNSLTGSIPQNIGNCTAFQVLYVSYLTFSLVKTYFYFAVVWLFKYVSSLLIGRDLSYNQLTGEIPFNIGFLQVATFLSNVGLLVLARSLQGNQLSGPIPSVIGLMQALAVLDLSSNALSGSIPPILGNLTYTEKLYLHGNKLNGSIPPELGQMTKLHYLELNDNHLTGYIPPELGKLTDLYDLNVANNYLQGPIPDNLSSCTNLNSLNVHGNKLNGTIPPALQRLESMTYLNLSSNHLRGPIPIELSRIGNLDTLDISNNKLSGTIPSSLGDLEHLLKLNLSRNHLTGFIPGEFGNLRSVMEIDLSSNQLTGLIPQELSQLQNMNLLRLDHNNISGDVVSLINCFSLSVLNVSYNNLAGDIPTSKNFSRFSPDSFIGNPDLCGYWLNSRCHESRPTERVTLSKAAILGIALGALVILLMILVAACRPYNPTPFPDGTFDKPVNYSTPKLVILNMNMALHVYEDIMRMTENLSEKYIIGYGASSTVYKCVLKNCKPVAIKKLYSHYPQCMKEFETELATVGSIKHRNLVTLQGYSLSSSGNLLFYDYMENGSLWDLLHGPSKKKKLDWTTRLQIALGTAQGLAYLHHDCSPRIIHRDIKSSNILLDKDFEAHLTDFGIAKNLCPSKTHTSTYIMGTIGYIDPEYARTSRLTEKSDVYSYGIVLLELLTGRKAVDNESNLHHLILSKTANNAVMETVDSDVTATCTDLGAVKKVFQLALLCTKRQPTDRPTMHEVTRVLGSLVPSPAPPKQPASANPPSTQHPSAKAPCYVDEYANLKTPHMLNCPSMSTSDAQLFLKFGETCPTGAHQRKGPEWGSHRVRCTRVSVSTKMSLRRGSKVWVEDRDLAWAPAEVADWKGKQLQVVTASGKKVLASPEKLFPRDADEDEHGGVDDMTRLTYLNEPGVLYNLQRRYALNEIYTYTGSILIAVNPFTRLPHLYNVHMMEQYKGAPFGELSPHVFAVADASYRAMMNDGRSQSILVSGESGAGKTETTKLIMQYLTYVGGRAAGAGDERTVEQQVLESNPLLEAFGNARTVRNDNSSRFGKFVEIQFDASGRISGAAIRTYLLERSRVVQITDPERNYHCFYQLCASGKDAEKYKLGHPSHFHYLNQSKTYELAGVSSAEEYTKTRTAMDIVGISREDQEAIFRTLAAILHLGNIDFSPGKEHDSSVLKDQKSNFHMQMAANLFMCDVDLLLATLSTRTIQTREGVIVKALDCSGAISSRDALAKTVYSRLVDKINTSVGQDVTSQLQIGVLDIYGFECFKDNSFEQFCINFANEKLQQHFNEHVFKMEQEEYSKEEIDWSYIEFIDNQDVLDLIEKVTYHTDTFLDKNRDYVVVEHCNLLSSSKCPFVVGLFGSLPEESSRSSYKFSSVATRFKQQLQALMETLNSTEPHYIRCVKPNSLNQPQKFENLSILHQLRCGGVLEAVRISLAGYPTRRTYAEFIDRFGLLASQFIDGRYEAYDPVGWYSHDIIAHREFDKVVLSLKLGRTKVFLRAGQIGILDFRRAEVLDNAAKLIQCQLRTFVARKDFVSKRAAAFAIQAFCRGCLARALYTLKRETAAAILIQKHVRRRLLKCAYMELYSAATVIQSNIRGFSIHQRFLHGKKHKAATLIQARWRMYKVRLAFQHHQASVVAIQCLWRQKLARRLLRRLKQEANETGALRLAKGKLEKQLEDLTWRLQLEKRLRISNEEAKSIEISKIQKVLESLSLELDASKLATINEYNKNAVLQNQLELSVKEKSSLEREIIGMAELRRESAFLKSSLDALDKKNSALETELLKAQSDNTDTIQKLQEFEQKCNQLQQNVKSLEEKLSVLEEENLIMRLKALSVPAKSTRRDVEKSVPEKNSGALVPITDQNPIFESPTPTKMFAPSPFSHGLPESRRSKLAVERHQENYEFLSRCVKEDLGFKDSKPLAACIIYKCLLQWHAFESERTVIFDHIIEGINDVLKVGDENIKLPYWLSNASALLCLLQRNLRPNSFPATQRSGSSVLAIRIAQGLTSPFKYIGYEDGMSHLEARYPAILFKQQLTACVEKIFGLMRDSLKKELAPLLGSCIQAPKAARKSSRSPGNAPQQLPGSQWDNIIKFLDTLMSRLHGNHYAGTSWHELNYIRQAVGFLVIHQKRKKSLDEIRQDLCPVVAQMRENLNKDNQNLTSNSFLLDDDLSIPFSTEDIDKAIPLIDPSEIELPSFLSVSCPAPELNGVRSSRGRGFIQSVAGLGDEGTSSASRSRPCYIGGDGTRNRVQA